MSCCQELKVSDFQSVNVFVFFWVLEIEMQRTSKVTGRFTIWITDSEWDIILQRDRSEREVQWKPKRKILVEKDFLFLDNIQHPTKITNLLLFIGSTKLPTSVKT